MAAFPNTMNALVSTYLVGAQSFLWKPPRSFFHDPTLTIG